MACCVWSLYLSLSLFISPSLSLSLSACARTCCAPSAPSAPSDSACRRAAPSRLTRGAATPVRGRSVEPRRRVEPGGAICAVRLDAKVRRWWIWGRLGMVNARAWEARRARARERRGSLVEDMFAAADGRAWERWWAPAWEGVSVAIAGSYCSAVSADPLPLLSVGEKGSVSPTFVRDFSGSHTDHVSDDLHTHCFPIHRIIFTQPKPTAAAKRSPPLPAPGLQSIPPFDLFAGIPAITWKDRNYGGRSSRPSTPQHPN